MVNRVGVSTTHNEPSTLTPEEKALRRKRRSLKHEISTSSEILERVEAQLAAGPKEDEVASLEVKARILGEVISASTVALAELEGVSGVN